MYTYSFLDVNCSIVGPALAASVGNGSAAAEEGIDIEPTEDINKMDIGADGKGMHSLHADKSGKVTLRFLKNSPLNAILSAAYAFQTASAASHGQNTIALNVTSSGDSVTCTQCAFRKAPPLKYAKDGDMISWEFDCVSIDRLLGAG